jgi:Flp pilus assembly protein CpaB
MSFFKRGSRSSSGANPATTKGGRKLVNIPLIIGGVLVVAVFASVFYFMTTASSQYTYFTANKVIAAGEILTATDVSQQTASGSIPGNNIIIGQDAMNNVLGEMVVKDIDVNDIVQSTSLLDRTKTNGIYRFSQLLKTNERGIVISGDPTSAYIRKGDNVDIYFVSSTDNSVRRLFTKPIILVVPIPVPGTNEQGGVTQPSGTFFALGNINAQEAQDLIWAQANGTLRISIATADTNGSTTTVSNQNSFNQTYGQSVSGSPAPGSSDNPGSSSAPVATPIPVSSVPGLP